MPVTQGNVDLDIECQYPTICAGNKFYLWMMPFGLGRFILELSVFTIRQWGKAWLQHIGTKQFEHMTKIEN